MFDAMALSPAFSFDHSAQLPTIPRLNVGSFRAYAALWHGRFSLFAAIID